MFRSSPAALFTCLVLSAPAAAQNLKAASGARPAGPVAPIRFQVLDPGLILHPGTSLHFAGPILTFVADEATNGADLNGDGDFADRVPHVYDGRVRTLTSLGWSVGSSSLWNWPGEEVCAFLPGETEVGADLDGDGILRDRVLQLFVTASQQLVNTGADASESDMDDNMVGHSTHDLAFGFQDASNVTRCFDVPSATLRTFPTSWNSFQVLGRRFFHGGSTLKELDLDTGIETDVGPYSLVLAGPDLTLLAEREWASASDLNGDGDAEDVVFSIRDEAAGTLFGTQLAHWDRNRTLFYPLPGGVYDDLIAFSVWENAQGGIDLNGDGGLGDDVLHFYNPASQSVINTAVPGLSAGIEPWNQKLLVPYPSGLGIWDLATDTLTQTGILASLASIWNEGRRALRMPETAATGDLNSDGDVTGDLVLHLFQVETLALTNLGFAVGDVRMGKRHLAFTVRESQQNRDLNGDADLLDEVLHVHWLATGETVNLGLAGSIPQEESASPAPDQGHELGPWVPFETSDDRPLLIRVY